MTGEKMLRASDVAKMLDLDIQRVYDYTRKGLLPSIRIGKIIRYSPAQIHAFIEKGGKAYDYYSHEKY